MRGWTAAVPPVVMITPGPFAATLWQAAETSAKGGGLSRPEGPSAVGVVGGGFSGAIWRPVACYGQDPGVKR